MILTLDAAGGDLASIDLGEPGERGYYEEGQLGATAGNLYLNVDGKEYGSLFFYQQDGRLTITLGQFDAEKQDWVEKAVLDHPVDV